MEINGNQWKSMVIHGKRWKSMESKHDDPEAWGASRAAQADRSKKTWVPEKKSRESDPKFWNSMASPAVRPSEFPERFPGIVPASASGAGANLWRWSLAVMGAKGKGLRAEGRGQRAEGKGRGQRAEGREQRVKDRNFFKLLQRRPNLTHSMVWRPRTAQTLRTVWFGDP